LVGNLILYNKATDPIAIASELEGEAEAEPEGNLEGITARREQHGTVIGQIRMEEDNYYCDGES
jgi:hypothetical protein